MDSGFPSGGYSPYVVCGHGWVMEQSYEDYLVSRLKEINYEKSQPYVETEFDKLLKILWKANYGKFFDMLYNNF